MGNTNPFHTLHTGKTSCYNFDYGCDHHSDSVKIIDFKYKTVPLTDEETKILYKRLMKLTGNSTIEATFGIKSDDYDGTQEIVQCTYHCDECDMKKFITIELWPEGSIVRKGKYIKEVKTNKTLNVSNVTIADLDIIYEKVKSIKFDVLHPHSSCQKFCDKVWTLAEECENETKEDEEIKDEEKKDE